VGDGLPARGVVRGDRRTQIGKTRRRLWHRRPGGAPLRYRQESEYEKAIHERRGRAHDARDLSEEDVEGIRTGAIPDPSVGQVAALAGAFGVEPSYLLDRGEPVFDGELVEALRDEAVREATLEISRPSGGGSLC